MSSEFTPKLFSLLKEKISLNQIIKDVFSGVVVGIIALPLAIAFGIASGVSPEKGIITAIIAGFIISFFGGSRVQIGGPTGAFIVIVYATIKTYGINGLYVATFMAGIILIIMGLFKMGNLLKYIPQTLIIGFTTGIALIIFTTQIKDLLGLNIPELPENLLLKWFSYIRHIGTVNWFSVLIAVITLLIITLLPRINKKIPWTLVAIIVTAFVVNFFKLPVATIYSKFGEMSKSIPTPAFIDINLSTLKTLLVPAFSIAILGALESLLSAVVADSMIGGNHRSNMELIAQGIANIVSPIFQGIPATGAIARTAANIKNGGRTPIAGVVHAITLLIIFLVAMPAVKYIPLPSLAAILVVVAWNMSEIGNFINTCKINIYETMVLLTTFFLTVLTDLTISIPVGFLLAVILLMKRMADYSSISPLFDCKGENSTLFNNEIGTYSDKILIIELYGPLFFGSVHHLLNINNSVSDAHKVVILRFRYVPIIDTTGLTRFKEIVSFLQKKKIHLIISGANERVANKLLKNNMLEESNLVQSVNDALEKANEHIAS